MKKIMKDAHEMTKRIVEKYGVNYKTQLGLCLAYLLENKESDKMLKELNFEKQGIRFCFRNFEMKNNGERLVAEWKVVGHKENKSNDGYCYNAEYYEKYGSVRNVFLASFKINGKKMEGIKVPEEYIEEINKTILQAQKEYKERKIKEQKEKDSKFLDDTIIKINYTTSHGFILYEYRESSRGKEISTMLENKNIARKVENAIKDYQTGSDWGDYTITTYFEITVEKFEKIVKKVYEEITIEKQRKQAQREAEREAIFKMAKETGEKQVLNRWSEPCNDPNEECDIDNLIEYAMPDGTTKTVRYHTW